MGSDQDEFRSHQIHDLHQQDGLEWGDETVLPT